jgi:hypothetical protein
MRGGLTKSQPNDLTYEDPKPIQSNNYGNTCCCATPLPPPITASFPLIAVNGGDGLADADDPRELLVEYACDTPPPAMLLLPDAITLPAMFEGRKGCGWGSWEAVEIAVVRMNADSSFAAV